MTPAEAYEHLLVPALFQPWAEAVLPVVDPSCGHAVLDIACGTGCLTRLMAARVAPTGQVHGLDCSGDKLAVARRLAPECEWHLGNAGTLPFPDASFDRVTCQFGLMFFEDPERALREMRRVSRGSITLTCWNRLEHNGAFADLDRVYLRHLGPDLEDMLQAPYRFGDPDALLAVMDRAGLPGAFLRTLALPARYPSVTSLLDADRLGWMAACGLQVPDPDSLQREAETLLVPYLRPEGLAFPTSAHVVGWRQP